MRSAFMIFGILLSTAAGADDFDWHAKANQTTMLGAFSNMAGFCSELGFGRVAKQSDELMRSKIEAYLLLQTSGDYTVERWAEMLHKVHEFNAAPDDHALIDRAADALIAASKDPDSYKKAEQLYVDTAMIPASGALKACQDAAADEFLGKYYITGTGSLDRFEEEMRKAFSDSVADVRADSSKTK